jgi:flagellar basal body rod protein FlgF
MRSMQLQIAVLGTISAFAYRHRGEKKERKKEKKKLYRSGKNLCRGTDGVYYYFIYWYVITQQGCFAVKKI